MLCRVGVDDIIDLLRGHAGADLARDSVQHTGVELGADPDLLDLLRCFDQLMPGDDFPLKHQCV